MFFFFYFFVKVVEITIVGMCLLWSKMLVVWVKWHAAVLIHYVFLRMDGQCGLLEVETMVNIIIIFSSSFANKFSGQRLEYKIIWFRLIPYYFAFIYGFV